MLITLYLRYEFSFDRYHENYENVYRLNQQYTLENMQTCEIGITSSPVGPALFSDLSSVKAMTRLRLFDIKGMFTVGDSMFSLRNFAFVDSMIFDVFTIPLIYGNAGEALTDPNSMVIDECTANKFFGDANPVGKTIKFGNKLPLKVTGVMKNFPYNSHLQLTGLVSFDVAEKAYPWMDNWEIDCLSTYIRLADKTPQTEIESRFRPFFRSA